MVKVDKPFISYFTWAVKYIALNSYANYAANHITDPYFYRTVMQILHFLDRYNEDGYNLPPSTKGWSFDDMCQWFYFHYYDFGTQNIPSKYSPSYDNCMERTRPDGSLKRRSPYHINDHATAGQRAVRTAFLEARDCFLNQINTDLIINPTTGFKSRGYWYNASLGSGLFYYNYFMKATLDIMFGPLIHDTYPFIGQQTPAWCSSCQRCEEWSYTPMFIPDFLHTTHDVPLIPGTYTATFNTRALPDASSPTPGDPNVLWVRVGAQGLNAGGEPTGPISYFTINPIGPAWSTGSFTFDVGPSTTSIYVFMEYQSGDGDYLLYFRNFQFSNFAGDLVYLIYGSEGNGFGWEVGAGNFSFKQYTNA